MSDLPKFPGEQSPASAQPETPDTTGDRIRHAFPAIVMLTFLWKKNPFGASVGLWWLGQSFMDLTPYIDDALVQQLVLLGGRTGVDQPGYHDWNNILGDLNMLERARDQPTGS